MKDEEIKQTWRKLLTQIVIGIIVLTTTILFHRLGSKRPGSQTLWMFAGVLGSFFTVFPAIKMIKFHQYLKIRKHNSESDSVN